MASNKTKIILPALYQAQQRILSAVMQSRIAMLKIGRRAGKTELLINHAINRMLTGSDLLYVSTLINTIDVRRKLRMLLAPLIHSKIVKENRSEGLITAPSACGSMMIRTFDTASGIRGPGFDDVIIDEAAHMRGLRELVEQELLATIAQRSGRLIMATTPNGANDFKYFWDSDAFRGPEYLRVSAPSSISPFFPAAEIERMRLLLPELVFRQEYLAEFVDLAGVLFRRDWITLIDHAPIMERKCRFWDLAVSVGDKSDYTVGVLVGVSDGGPYVLDVVRGRWLWPDVVRTISETAILDGPTVTQAVEGGGQQRGMFDTLIRDSRLAGLAINRVDPVGKKIERWLPLQSRAGVVGLRVLSRAWTKDFIDELVSAGAGGGHDDQIDAVSGAWNSLSGVVKNAWFEAQM